MTASERAFSVGLGVPNGGDFADPQALAELAADAEAAGWDGIFLWDHVIRRPPWQPMVDPWIALTAMAMSTERLVLGPMVTPLARRRVSNVARQSTTLDRLSGGRLRLGVGLGAPEDEFTRFGESGDARLRADILDESLDVLLQLWSGETVHFRGDHVVADGVRFLPRPVGGRVPIWVAGRWPGGRPFRRAARHDGVWPVAIERGAFLTVDEFGACVRCVAAFRHEAGIEATFDACRVDTSDGPDDDRVLSEIPKLVASGMTWWIESLDEPDIPFDRHRDRVRAGPIGSTS